MIYLDNSATSYFKPQSVIEGISEYLMHPGNPDRGGHTSALDASRYVLETRIKLGEFFDADDFSKVIFTSGITESLNIVIQGLFKEGDHVITTYKEHNSVLRPLYKQQVDLTITDGTVEDIEKHIKEHTKAIIINHVSNVTGEIQDIHEIGKLAKKHNLLFIVDSAQSAGVLHISMKKDNIDILCFTGHKGLLGIQGIGGLCLSSHVDLPSFKVGGSGIHSFDHIHPQDYPTRLEAGTLNIPGIISLYHSIDYILDYTLDKIYHHEIELANMLIDKLKDIPGIKIYREKDKQYVGIVTFEIEGYDSSYIADMLSFKFDIATRAGAHCAPLVHEHYNTTTLVRVSFGLCNTKNDINHFIEAIKQIIE